jgi:hypothetical protein
LNQWRNWMGHRGLIEFNVNMLILTVLQILRQ